MFDALDSPNGVRGVKVCRVHGSSAYKELRQTFVLLEHSESAAPPSAQDLETPEITAWLRRLIVTPGQYCERQSLGRFLPRAFAGENAIAYSHTELAGLARISGDDVGLNVGQVLFGIRNLPWEVANLPTDVALLIGVNCT
jgi:hypothetical protein